MHNHEYYSEQAEGCRRLAASESDPNLIAEIEALARRYDAMAALWPVELLVPAN